MKRRITKLLVASTALAVGMALMPMTVAAKKPSGNVTVDCDAGQSVQAALDKASLSVPLTLTVVGTCEEDVTIRRDDVGIYGNDNATVNGTFWLFGSQRIVIGNITVSGLGYGVHAIGSEVTLNKASIVQNEGWAAVVASQNSSLTTHDSSVSDNHGSGVFVGHSSSLVASTNTVINNNAEAGVIVDVSSSALLWDGAAIGGNGVGVTSALRSSVDLENANVSNNTFRGIYVNEGGAVRLRGENVISGNNGEGVFCNDTESSFVNHGTPIADPVLCTGFNQ